MSKIELPESENYVTIVGESEDKDSNRTLYKIINKTTNVVEFETPMLPQAYTILDQFEETLAYFRKEEAEGKPNVVQLVPKH